MPRPKAGADFDLRWKVALGIEIEDRPFAKSIFQVFRAQLILHDKVREVFEHSLRLAREAGYPKRGRGMRVALDTTYILGRGAVKDTYNLPADGIVKLMQTLAEFEEVPLTVPEVRRLLCRLIWQPRGRPKWPWPGSIGDDATRPGLAVATINADSNILTFICDCSTMPRAGTPVQEASSWTARPMAWWTVSCGVR